jgi:hypothetical protein
MNYKSILIIIGFCALSFALFFLKSSAYPFNSMDSYFFLNFINGITTSIPATPPLALWIFSILPSSIIILKLITFCVLVITMFIFCKTADNYAKDYWWLALALFLSSTIFMQVFYTLEDDLFAFPLIALCFYFISLYHKHAKNKYIIYSLISLLIAGMIWRFSIFFILLFLFWTRFEKTYILASILSIPFIPSMIKSLIPSFQVIENIPGLALYSLFTGCMFLLYFKIVNNPVRKFMPTIWLATILMILNTKFVFLAVPVFILVFVQVYKKIPTKLKYLIVLSILTLFIAGTIINSTTIPNKHTKELFDVAQSKQVQDYPTSEINCSWDFGYYYQFYFKKDYPVFGHVQPTIKKGIVITNKFENINECIILYTNKQGKVWNCN